MVECPAVTSTTMRPAGREGRVRDKGLSQVAQAVVGKSPVVMGRRPMPKWYFAVGGLVILGLIMLSIFWPKPPDPLRGGRKLQ